MTPSTTAKSPPGRRGRALAPALCAQAFCALALFAGGRATAAIPALVPAPMSVQAQGVPYSFHAGAEIAASSHDAGAQAAARRLAELMARTRGFALKVHATAAAAPAPIAFVRSADVQGGDEAYDLEIGPDGAKVTASGDAGLFYGAETLWQLMTAETGKASTIAVEGVKIHDAPRFVWRGLLLDSARHFQQPAEVERVIDEMAAHKLNVLHWHLSDDQGWRLEIRKYPRLTEVGAWRIPAHAPGEDAGKLKLYGGFYTQAEARRIVAYALARHVAIVPEFDMPGHATAALVAYPQWGTVKDLPAHPPTDWGVFTNLYSPDDSTVSALQDILGEVMEIFPGRFIHVGGDEAVKLQWRTSPQVQARIKALGLHSEDELQAWFIGRMDSYLTAHGRRLVGWDEILDGGLAPGATVMSWRGVGGAIAAAKAGHDAVLSPAPVLYFDNRQSGAPDEPAGRGAVITLAQVYAFNPIPADMTPAEQAHVLGLQGNLWTEHIRTDAEVEHMIFPRAAAVAETGWSPAKGRDFADFARREAVQLKRDHALGFGSADSAFTPQLSVDGEGGDRVRVALSTQSDYGEIHYTLDGSRPDAASPVYSRAVEATLPLRLRAEVFAGSDPVARPLDKRVDRALLETRTSQQLHLCTEKLALNPEDDVPAKGPRTPYLVDILNPCWVWRQADLDGIGSISAAVARLPFNFQLGEDPGRPVLHTPATPDGELEVRLDGCDGAVIATASLKPAEGASPVATLPAVVLPPRTGKHDLCFTFTGKRYDPMWVLDKIRLLPAAAEPRKPS